MTTKIALITGANKGIGLEIARQTILDFGFTIMELTSPYKEEACSNDLFLFFISVNGEACNLFLDSR